MKSKLLMAVFAGFAISACAGESEADQEDYAEMAEAGYEGAAPVAFGNESAAEPVQYAQANTPASQPAYAPAPNLPKGAVRVKPAKIIDRNGFGQPMVAATMMVPVGWQTQGGIVWQQNMSGCGPNTPHINWTATAPDGSSAIQMLPEEKWTGHNMQYPGMPQSQCPNVTITDPRQYATQYIQRLRPGARILDYRERGDIVEAVSKMLPPPMQNMPGMEFRQWIGAGDALIGYNMQGREMRELVGVVALFGLTRMSDGMGGVTEMYSIFSLPTFAYRALDGQLDFDKAAMVRNSYRADPQWSAKMAQHNAKIAGINAKGAADRSRITSQTYNEISDMQMDSWRKQQASSDRNQREFSEYIRGVETYNDPYNGGTVQLDNTYENAWQLNDGTFVLTDDASFNPYAATGQDGQKLEPTP